MSEPTNKEGRKSELLDLTSSEIDVLRSVFQKLRNHGSDMAALMLIDLIDKQAISLNNMLSLGSLIRNDINVNFNDIQLLKSELFSLRQFIKDQNRMAWFQSRVTSHARTRVVENSFEQYPDVAPPHSVDFEGQLSLLGTSAPLNFQSWLGRFEAGRIEYLKRLPSSLSTPDHVDAVYFRNFIYLYIKGRILDIGVGPLSRPSYLDDIPTRLIAGIDPLDAFEPHPFMFSKCFAEFIPWGDSSFETVIAATSIDHVYLLDRALEEIKRVLVKGGRFLLWCGMFEETVPYEPYFELINPPDEYHLFHPGENWFVQEMTKRFRLIERFDLPNPGGYTPSFFAFEKI